MILSIDHHDVEQLLKNAKTVYSWDFGMCGKTISEKRESFLITLADASNVVCRKGGYGYFWVVVSAKMLSFIEGVRDPIWTEEYLALGSSQVDYLGVLNLRWRLYCDQYMNAEQVLVGLGGTDNIPERFARISVSNFVS